MKSSLNPLVSIIINCFNGDKFLSHCLESIKKQSYKNWEVIFWDNQSSDKSKNVFIRHKNKKMKYFLSPKFYKLHKARNEAVKKTKGNLICFLDVDDVWLPNKLSEQIKIYCKNPNVGLIYGNLFIENKNTLIKKKLFTKKKLPEGLIFNDLLNSYPVSLSSIMFNKSILKKYRLKFNEKYEIISDFDLVLKIASVSKIFAVQKPILIYRIHGDNYFLLNKKKYIDELIDWLKKSRKVYKDIKEYHFEGIKKKIDLLKFDNEIHKFNFINKLKILFKIYKKHNLNLRLLIYAFLPIFIIKKIKFFE